MSNKALNAYVEELTKKVAEKAELRRRVFRPNPLRAAIRAANVSIRQEVRP